MPLVYKPSSDEPWNWIEIAGPDARDFLHRMTTVDVRNMDPGQGTHGFFLTAQGKLRAYFTLWCLEETRFAFEMAGGRDNRWKQELLSVIDQFHFGEKFALSENAGETSLDCRWIFTDSSQDSSGAAFIRSEGPFQIAEQGSRDFGRPWTTVWGPSDQMESWLGQKYPSLTAVERPEIESWRILALRPRIDVELTENTIPLEVGLKEGIAENKGCYPGQEVIERIVALGAPARRLAQIQGSGQPPKSGDKIMNLAEPPVEVGEVTSVFAKDPESFVALAMIKKIHAKEGLEVRFENAQGSVTQVAPYA